MLKFKRLQPGVYISECEKFGINCTSYPTEWSVYEREEHGIFELRAVCSLLCLAKREAQRLYERRCGA